MPLARLLLALFVAPACFRSTFAYDADPISFSPSQVGSSSIEDVVSGLMSLRAVMNVEMIGKVKWSLQNSLTASCGPGTQVIAGAIWRLPAPNEIAAQQDLELLFSVLPLPGKGGACAQALTSAAVGGTKGSWSESNPQPTFRKMLEDQFSALGGSLSIMASAEVRLWRITCLRRPVVIPPGTPRSNGPSGECSSFLPGWEVYSTQNAWTALSRLNNSIGFGTVSVETGGTDSDICSKAATPCLCSFLSGCSWLPHSSGSKRCQKGDRVTCTECWQQSSCSPDCVAATDACSCAAMIPSLRCRWLSSTGSCGLQPQSAMAPNISCSACIWQEKCASLAPLVESLSPTQFTLMTRSGPGSLLTANFSSPLRPENISGLGSIIFYCGRDGQPSSRNEFQSRKYVMPTIGLSTDGDRTLILDTSTVHVQQESKCEVVFEAGVIEGVQGLPSQAFLKGHSIVMPDTVPPQVISFAPSRNQLDVPMHTSEITFYFDERIFVASSGFRAYLTPLAIRGSARAPPLLLPLSSIQERLVILSIPSGLLQTGILYTVNISAQSVHDLDKNSFPGLATELYTFTTEGVFVDVRVVSQEGLSPFTLNIIIGASVGAGCCIIFGVLLFLRCRWKRHNKTGQSPAKSSERPSPELFKREKLPKQASTAIGTISAPCASNGWAWVFDESEEQVKMKPGSPSVAEYGRPVRGCSPTTSRTNSRNPVNRTNVDPTSSIHLQRNPLQLTNEAAHKVQLRQAASFVEQKKLLN